MIKQRKRQAGKLKEIFNINILWSRKLLHNWTNCRAAKAFCEKSKLLILYSLSLAEDSIKFFPQKNFSLSYWDITCMAMKILNFQDHSFTNKKISRKTCAFSTCDSFLSSSICSDSLTIVFITFCLLCFFLHFFHLNYQHKWVMQLVVGFK